MIATVWGVLNFYVFLLTAMLLMFSRVERIRSTSKDSFNRLLGIVLVLIVLDSLSRLNAVAGPDWKYHLMRFGGWGVFAMDPFGYAFALLYIASYVEHPDQKRQRIFMFAMVSYAIINFVTVTASELLNLGWFYTYTDRIYARGPLFVPRAIVNVIFCVIVLAYVLLCRKYIHAYYRKYIELFPLIVIIGGVLQVTVSGAAYEYAATTFACIMLYTHVQNRNLNVDYLTGIMNRRGIDKEMENYMNEAGGLHTFSAFMIDLDFFKKINDDCGHDAGDEALRTVADILRTELQRVGSIGRYGGDEFLAVTNLIDPRSIDDVLEKIQNRIDEFNAKNDKPYKIGLSVGWAIYDWEKYPSAREFLKQIDDQMYEQKLAHHQKNMP